MKVRVWMLRDAVEVWAIDAACGAAMTDAASAAAAHARKVQRFLPETELAAVDVEIPDDQIDAAFAAEGAQHG